MSVKLFCCLRQLKIKLLSSFVEKSAVESARNVNEILKEKLKFLNLSEPSKNENFFPTDPQEKGLRLKLVKSIMKWAVRMIAENFRFEQKTATIWTIVYDSRDKTHNKTQLCGLTNQIRYFELKIIFISLCHRALYAAFYFIFMFKSDFNQIRNAKKIVFAARESSAAVHSITRESLLPSSSVERIVDSFWAPT